MVYVKGYTPWNKGKERIPGSGKKATVGVSVSCMERNHHFGGCRKINCTCWCHSHGKVQSRKPSGIDRESRIRV